MDGPSCRCGALRLNAEPNSDRKGPAAGEPFDESSTVASPRVDGWASTGLAAVGTGADSGARCRVVGRSGRVPTSGASFGPSPLAWEAQNSPPPIAGAAHSSPPPLAGEGRVGAPKISIRPCGAHDSPPSLAGEGSVGALRLR